MLEKLAEKYRAAMAAKDAYFARIDREYERSRPIEILVRIPYTPGNEAALRGLKVGNVNSSVMVGLTIGLPVPLERVEVRCVGNPDWRK